MTFKQLLMHYLIRFLDRPGGRFVLGRLATMYARYRTDSDFEIQYRGTWIHRVDQYYFQGGDKFNYDMTLIWQQISIRSISEDYWFPFYHPKRGEVIIDVGAGRGEDIPAFLDAVGETGRVIAIEAHPTSFKELEAFCRLNRRYNVTLLQVALMDKPGFVTVTDLNEWESNAVNQKNDSNTIHVQANTLDNICKSEFIEDISFLKINIEGAERYALLGMDHAIRRCKVICVACHDFRAERGESEQFRTRAFVEQYLVEHGFKLASRKHDSRDYVRDHIFGLK